MSDKNLDSLVRDDNNTPIMTGSGILTVDSSGTPKESPLAFGVNGNEQEISIPATAAEIVIRPSADLRIYEATGSSSYFVIPADIPMAFGVGRSTSIFIDGDVGAGTVNFYFVTV